MTIYFDMDGTIVDLYGVENWLSYLQAQNPYPYIAAKPLLHLSTMAYRLHKLQAAGYKLGVISWLAKNSTPSYNKAVTAAKLNWLKRHLPSIQWDEIQIVAYGTPKHTVAQDTGFLFDDETKNLLDWYTNGKGQVCYPDGILGMLEFLENFFK